MHDFMVDRKLCIQCGACVRVCAWAAIEKDAEGFPIHSPARENLCIACQQCLAVCPKGAVSVSGKDPGGCPDASLMPSLQKVEALVRLRRSVRFFRPEPVEPSVLDNLIKIAANAPSGTNSRRIRYTVVEGEALRRFREAVYAKIEELDAAGLIPERIWYIKLMPKSWRNGKDVIFRDAPHLIIVSSGKDASTPYEDGIISLTTFDLVAQSAGLGTLWLGFLSFIMELAPEMVDALGMGAEQKIAYAMLAGHPDVRFRRGVDRGEMEIVRPFFG